MLQRYLNFLRGISVNWLGKIGVILVTSSFIAFLTMEMLRLTGAITNDYIGLITYMLFPALFVFGLLLIPFAWMRYRRQRGKSTRELLDETFSTEDLRSHMFGSRLVLNIGALTLLNVIFMLAVSARTLHFMDSAHFCGTACHRVMNPEWTTYQRSPHARVACVECHVGEGVKALIDSKLNGLRQMVLAATNTYNRPIPTPVHQLRPSRETCEKCHWPDHFYGERLLRQTHYAPDRHSTASHTSLLLRIESYAADGKAGIHWHISDRHAVRYAAADARRESIAWTEVVHPDGSTTRYQNTALDPSMAATATEVRTMDCVDCHNRATHIYEEPGSAVDRRLVAGELPLELPFIKREGLAAIRPFYPDTLAARQRIDAHLRGFYRRLGEPVQAELVDKAVAVLQSTYTRNVHPQMQLDWNTYPSLIGHRTENSGCFRCHQPAMQGTKGDTLAHDCFMCHRLVAWDESDPYRYFSPAPDSARDRALHDYLHRQLVQP
ncbi:MAG TPA: NapC/NirT family cytochrome c [bacterium]|nr:NapC/NirT family cytochrome c [bacterium]HNT66645.1 NapC/NirT family cytochrome c [bacterium]